MLQVPRVLGRPLKSSGLAALRFDPVKPILGKQQCCAGQDGRCPDLGESIKDASLFDISPDSRGHDLLWCQVAAELGIADKAQVLECISIMWEMITEEDL